MLPISRLVAQSQETSSSSSNATLLFPALQFASIGLRHEQALTASVLSSLRADARLWLASGYMNLEEGYTRLLAALPPGARAFVLGGSPSASGWHGAAGPTRHVPALYALALKRILRRVPQDRVRVLEWQRQGWTFHAKGLWLGEASAPALPTLTALGSTNFGTRSTERDVECQFFLTTSDAALQESIAKERDALFSYARPVTDESLRRQLPASGTPTGIGLQIAARALRTFL